MPGEEPGHRPGAACRAVAPRSLELELHLLRGVELGPFLGKRRPGDVAAKLLQPVALMSLDPHRGLQAQSVDVGAQRLAREYDAFLRAKVDAARGQIASGQVASSADI